MPETASDRRILIVEDNEMNRDLLSRRLKRRGFEVIVAVDGVDAMQKMREHHIELILMDMNLPIQDGWTTCQLLKDEPEWCDIPIIALTAHALTNDRERALIVGCSEYETKPIDFKRLIGKIELLLPEPSIAELQIPDLQN
ncbi:MAG: response regulator [Pseudomonadales bacterium]